MSEIDDILKAMLSDNKNDNATSEETSVFPNIASITCPPHIKQIPLLHNFHYPFTTKQLFSYRKTNSFL